MSPAGKWSEENSGKFSEQIVITYSATSVALKCAVMDLHIGTITGKNSSALEVACGPPGIGAKI
jgi:hypothetical protein